MGIAGGSMFSAASPPIRRGPWVWGLLLFCLVSLPSGAEPPSVVVLDFELYDLTDLPGTPEEIARTASLRPLVEQALIAQGGARPIPIDSAAIAQANRGFGYLFDRPEAAAELGRSAGADWVLVGRLHKPSFLFAYLKGRLVETRTGRPLAELVVEAKGQTRQASERAAVRLAERIGAVLAARAAEPVPVSRSSPTRLLR